MTKFLLPVLTAGLLALHAGAADADRPTAYTALRSMGKSLGGDALNRVIEVTGRGGTPQPSSWRIVVTEGAAGTREIRVSGARIVSQKASSRVSALQPIRLPDLNLDSTGAFDAANEQARHSHVPFAALDYSLRVSDASGKPVWDLELINDAGAHVGGARLAAHDGKLISTNGFDRPPSTAPRSLASGTEDHDAVQPTRVSPGRNTTTTTTTTTYRNVQPPPSAGRNDDGERQVANPGEQGGFFSRAGRTLDHTTDAVGDTMSRTGDTVSHTVRRTGAKLQRFFTGHGDPDQ